MIDYISSSAWTKWDLNECVRLNVECVFVLTLLSFNLLLFLFLMTIKCSSDEICCSFYLKNQMWEMKWLFSVEKLSSHLHVVTDEAVEQCYCRFLCFDLRRRQTAVQRREINSVTSILEHRKSFIIDRTRSFQVIFCLLRCLFLLRFFHVVIVRLSRYLFRSLVAKKFDRFIRLCNFI